MPYLDGTRTTGKKRKRNDDSNQQNSSSISINDSLEHKRTEIQRLENDIVESRKNYNNIANLLAMAKSSEEPPEVSSTATLALCRTFSRLLASGSFQESTLAPESELVILKWLNKRYTEYNDFLLDRLSGSAATDQIAALDLVMRLVKREVNDLIDSWLNGLFSRLVKRLLTRPDDHQVIRQLFIQNHFLKFGDVRFYTLTLIPMAISEQKSSPKGKRDAIFASLHVLQSLEEPQQGEGDFDSFLVKESSSSKSSIHSIHAHKKRAQGAWLAVLGSDLNKKQRKEILTIMVHQIVPWFTKIETLMDFLTDAYDVGGESSLLALAGVFHLIQERNLDYPLFYQKLYSLLDDGILQSKHRSRFFRLLDIFLGSTHLPAALVASFVKRLSRLALHAPPAGIVLVIPWVYNTFKRHPACTFMIHREARSTEERRSLEELGADDPFDMDEVDPMETGAIDSSVWELETLQSHYHPNVATLARIISEQFTKESYNLEDFLDHSYNSLLDTELEKDVKRTPVVEYKIPKAIFTDGEGGMSALGLLMNDALKAANV